MAVNENTPKNSPAGAEGLVAKWRKLGAEAERVFAENSAKIQRGEMVTFDVTSGPFVAIENKFADELEACLREPGLGREGLRELRELSEKATPGLWEAQKSSGAYPHCVHIRGPKLEYVAQSIRPEGPPPHSEETIAEKNVAFIIACVNYVRAALATPAASKGESL